MEPRRPSSVVRLSAVPLAARWRDRLQQAPPVAGDHAAQQERLRQYLVWNIRFAIAFAVLEGLAFARFRDIPTGLTALIIVLYTAVLGLARRWAFQGRKQAAVMLVCAGLLICVLIIGFIQPQLFPTLALVPLLVVVLALPYFSGRAMQRLIGICWLVTVIVVISGKLLPAEVVSTLPAWFVTVWMLVSLAAAAGLILLLLWQFSSRLVETLVRISAAEERYSLAVRGANDGVWDWDLTANSVYYAPRWAAMIGLTESQLGTSPEEWFGRIHPEDVDRVKAEVAVHLDGLTPHFESEYRICDYAGRYRWMISRGVAIRDGAGQAARMAGSQTDITRRKQVEEQLVHDAYHDALTQLPNRTLFLERLGRSIVRMPRQPDYLFAVLYLDLDRFKNVNDSLGHLAGDQLLVEFAQRLQSCLRPNDTLARLSGDEFAILLDGLSAWPMGEQVAQRIRAQLSRPFVLEGQEVFMAVSVGIALSAMRYQRPEEMLRDADIALYRAKGLGRSRHVVFDPSMHDFAVVRLQLEMDLRRAIEREEFVVYFQPIITLATGQISGFEALVRWQHPERGLLRPADFLGIAEETGLIAPIGWWVLREACRQLRVWDAHLPEHGGLTVNVNLSATQLTHADLLPEIERAFQEIAMDPRRLRLEITENVMIENVAAVAGVLASLRERGIGVQVDDFGTGYSSLGALHQLPIDALKIDRLFVRRIGEAGAEADIIRTIVTLAHSLGMQVVAEGVETAEELAYLRTLGCAYAQGYLMSAPVDGKTAQGLVAADRRW